MSLYGASRLLSVLNRYDRLGGVLLAKSITEGGSLHLLNFNCNPVVHCLGTELFLIRLVILEQKCQSPHKQSAYLFDDFEAFVLLTVVADAMSHLQKTVFSSKILN